jgi:phosphate starvation-inducible PhoH-like protein
MPHLTAKNDNQKKALRLLNSDTSVVFLTGSAGTGKSMLTAFRAATLYRSKRIEKIVLVRPAVAMGKSIGLLPGEVEEKMLPYFRQAIAHLEKFLGAGQVRYMLEKKVIDMQPAEYIRGMSMENVFVWVEEAQNFDHEEFETVLTRLGEGTQMVFTGDTRQNDLRSASGLQTTADLIEKMLREQPDYMTDEDLDYLESGFGIVRFLPTDVVRHGLTKAFVTMYFHQ